MSSDRTPLTDPAGALAAPSPDVCAGVVELVTEYLEGAMDAATRARFDAHLAGCDGCDVYLAQMRSTIAAAGQVDVRHATPATLERLIAAYRAIRGG